MRLVLPVHGLLPTMLRRFLAAALVVFIISECGPRAGAGPIYIEGNRSELATLDPTTGVVTEIGSTSALLYGIGFDATGKLYGLGSDRNLYAVNTSTAALSLIGPYTGNFNGGATMGSAADGTLYGVNGVGDIWTVNRTSGAATALGNIGVATNSNPSGDAGSNLYITSGNDLYRINRTTGGGTLIGAGSYGEIFGLAFTNGTMYAIETHGTGIYALDLTNGQSTLASNYSHSVVGDVYAAAAFTPATSTPVPSTLVMSSILFGIFGMVWSYKRMTATTAAA